MADDIGLLSCSENCLTSSVPPLSSKSGMRDESAHNLGGQDVEYQIWDNLCAGDKTAGAVRALYNPSLSERGVLFCAHRKPRPKDPFDFQVPLSLFTSPLLPFFPEIFYS